MRTKAAAALFCLLLGGCGTELPALVSQEILPMGVLVRAIHCELADAVRRQILDRNRAFLSEWQAAYNITLKGNEGGTLAADANKFPAFFGKGGSSVVVATGADIKGTANRTAVLKYTLNLSDIDLNNEPCSAGPSPSFVSHPFLRGKIGFSEWLDVALEGSLSDGTISSHIDNLTSVGHTFQFVVTTNAGVAPVFTLAPRAITLNPAISVSREEDNSVDVVFGKKATGQGGGATTVAKDTTPQQKQKMAELARVRDAGSKQAVLANEYLKSAEATRLAALQRQIAAKTAGLSELGFPKDIKGISPDADLPAHIQNTDRAPAVRNDLALLKRLQGDFDQSPDKQKFLQSEKEKADGEKQAAESQKAIEAIKADPKGLKVVKTGKGFAPPSENPNLTSTEFQLTLERVIGNARLRGF